MIVEILKGNFENHLFELKKSQSGQLWMSDLNDYKNELKNLYQNLASVLPGFDKENLSFEKIYNDIERVIRSKYNIRYEKKPEDIQEEFVKQFDPLEGTWLSDERLKILNYTKNFNLEAVSGTRLARYLNYLYKKQKFSLETVSSIHKEALSTIGRCGDPAALNDFFVKGMAVGSVQSGKTTNFNAVINSAYDAGYHMVIVLTGITENLRRQTQKRLNSDLGICERNAGVNLIDTDPPIPLHSIQSITNEIQDFNNAVLRADYPVGDRQSLIVAKKNTSSLFNIFSFLEEKINCGIIAVNNFSLLIVDDEADNATLNAKGANGNDNEATAINGLIRSILGLFKKKTYLAYTATPFANILQDNLQEGDWNYRERNFAISKNLFPEHFVRLLSPPVNYIGPRLFFNNTKSDSVTFLDFLVREIYDYKEHFPERVMKDTEEYVDFAETDSDFNRNSRLKDRFQNFNAYRKQTASPTVGNSKLIKSIPATLRDALMCFVITIAIRNIRRRENHEYVNVQIHDTMLIHYSRFSSWQNQLKTLLTNEEHKGVFDVIRDDLQNHGLNEGIYKDFERVWNVYYEGIVGNLNGLNEEYHDDFIKKHEFAEVVRFLPNAVTNIEILSLNTQSRDEIVYGDKSKKYIVIGGNTLSRGFTLEGLSISYFCRNTNYADAVLQMGRWFGYRPGYLDCCRLFVDERSLDRFAQCNEILEELEADIKMHMNDPQSVPSNVVNRIKSTTGRFFKITRPAILRNGDELYYSFSDKMLQAVAFDLDAVEHKKSFENFRRFIENYKERIEKKGKNLYMESQSFSMVRELINTSTLLNAGFDKERIFAFVEECIRERNFLSEWEIVFVNSGDGDWGEEIAGFDFNSVIRSGPNKYSELKDKRVVTREFKRLKEDKYYCVRNKSIISPTDLSSALSRNESDQVVFHGKNPKESDFRRVMPPSKGALLVYLIDTAKVLKANDVDEDINEILKLEVNIPIMGFAMAIPELGIEPMRYYVRSEEAEHLEVEEMENENF